MGSDLLERALRTRLAVKSCTSCELASTCRGPVPFSGTPTKRIVVVGEAPGGQEDKFGEPFVGSAGQKLRTILTELGYDHRRMGYVNTVSCFPGDTPTPAQVQACEANKWGQLRALAPEIVIPVGVVALRGFRPELKIAWVRGKPMYLADDRCDWLGGRVLMWPTYHPAAALRQKKYEQAMQEDLDELRGRLTGDWMVPWPEECCVCGKEVRKYDPWGVAWCANHAMKQGRLW